MTLYDLRTKPETDNELSFYLYSSPSMEPFDPQSIEYRVDTIQEAITTFQTIESEHPDWLIDLGATVGGIHEVRFIQRRDGDNAVTYEYRKSDFWNNRPDAYDIAEELDFALVVKIPREEFFIDKTEMYPPIAESDLPDTGKPFLDYRTNYGKTEKLNIEVATYENNNNLFVGMSYFDPELGFMDYYGDITVNTLFKLPSFMAAIDTNNNHAETIMNFLTENGFGEPTGDAVPSGFCMYPVFRFNEETLAKFDLQGFEQYCKDVGIERKTESLESLKQKAKERATEKNAERPKKPSRSHELEK